MKRVVLTVLSSVLLLVPFAGALGAEPEAPPAHPSQFGGGAGPTSSDGTHRLLDAAGSARQSNAIAFDRQHQGAHESVTLDCQLRVLKGGDGGAVVFLNTNEYGARGPAPFVKSWVEPNLRKSLAVGIDVHNPKNEEPFSPWGNHQGLPQREISLHWDGREIVKRVAPEEFRGDFAACSIRITHVVGGAEVTVTMGAGTVYDRYFVADVMPYESRLAFGAGTRAKISTEFDIKDLRVTVGPAASKRRRPLHVEVFNHVLTNNKKTSYETEISLPPLEWAFGRVILTLEIHDAGKDWDEWDRNGEVSIWDDEGVKRGIVPFITSYRTPCHWQVDVTHFRPYLSGKTRFEVAAGTTFYKNRGYMMSVSLDYHDGAPALQPQRVVPLWVGTAKYKSAQNHFSDFFTPQTVPIPGSVEAARVFITTTGHSQVGEFTPSKRCVVFAARKGGAAETEQRFDNTLWKTDCYLNPNRPQFGTWKFSRAGWAPGDVVRPWWIDLTPHLQPGEDAELRYEPRPYEFEEGQPSDKQINEASHVVRAYLILYEASDGAIPAPILRVTNVAKGSNAAKAGMQAGDYFVTYDGKRVDSLDELRAAMRGAAEAKKKKVAVIVFRSTARVELELNVGQMGVSLGQ